MLHNIERRISLVQGNSKRKRTAEEGNKLVAVEREFLVMELTKVQQFIIVARERGRK